MAKLKQGILGGIIGKIGNVVGSTWKGIAYIKTLPLSVANPQTAAQVAQRTRFANVVAFAKEILADVIKPLWDRFTSGQSGYNDFVSTNIDLFDATQPVDAEDLIIAKGVMAGTPIVSVTASPASAIVDVVWADDSGQGFKLTTDEAFIVGQLESDGLIGIRAGVVDRSAAQDGLGFSRVLGASETVNVWLAFRRADGTVVSNTEFGEDSTPP